MATRVNPVWLERTLENFKKTQQGGFYEVNETYTPGIKALCLALVNAQIPYKVIKMGGGVTKITNQVDICPKCGGSGKC